MTANDSKTAESPGWLELWISIDPVFAQAVKLKTDKWINYDHLASFTSMSNSKDKKGK